MTQRTRHCRRHLAHQHRSARAREHVLAVVEPGERGEESVDVARNVVRRGGKATVVLMITNRVRKHIWQFAKSEDIDFYEAEGIAIDQLSAEYAERIGVADTETIVAFSNKATPSLLSDASHVAATSVVVPQGLLGRHGLRRFASTSPIPVVVAPVSVG